MSEHTRILSSLGVSSFTKAKNCGTCWIGSSFGDHLADGFVYAHRYLEYTKEAVARARAEWHPPLVPTVAMEARAAAEWSAQLRAKVTEQRERDAEAARVAPYWSPEEQSGDDL